MSASAHAFDLYEPHRMAPDESLFSGDLMIRVVRYEEVLANEGDKVRCMMESNGFGYLVTKGAGDTYTIDTINNNVVEGEKSRKVAVFKDSENPLLIYISSYDRFGDFGTYFEMFIGKNRSFETNQLWGDSMFTEAYYSKEKGSDKEVETFKPIAKKRLKCSVEK